MITEDMKKDTTYRTYIYNRIDGVMVDKVVNAEDAEKFITEDGWKLTPASFTEDEVLKDNPQFDAAAADMANIMNVLLNIDVCDEKLVLMDIGNNFLGLKLTKNMKTKTMRFKIKTEAKSKGIIEVDSE